MAPKFFTLVASLLLACVAKCDEEPKADRLELMRHSFDSPLTAENGLGEWKLAGASVASKTSVVLVPGISERCGHFWHKLPLKTSLFEINFSFKVSGSTENPLGPGFAFWYSNEEPEFPPNLANGEEALPEGWNLFGYKNAFDGVGVFFSQFDRDNKVKSSISVAYSDGNNLYDEDTNVPTGDGVYYSPFRNTKDPLDFKFTAAKDGVTGEVRSGGSSLWTTTFHAKDVILRPGGWIGFTASTPKLEAKDKGDKVSIQQLHVFNMDMTQPGEDSEVLANAFKDVEVGDLLSENRHATDLPDVAFELRQLSRVIFKQISEQQPREAIMLKQLATQQEQVQQLRVDMRELHAKLDAYILPKTDDEQPADGGVVVAKVTDELQSLRSLFHSHERNQQNLQQSLSYIQRSIRQPGDLNHIAERSAALEATIKQQANFSAWMILGVILAIALFALFFVKRMRDMEKKHFL